MILTGSQIISAHQAGDVYIDPFSETQVNPNSYDYRLGETIIELSAEYADEEQIHRLEREPLPIAGQRVHDIPEDGFVLCPGRIYLANTLEVLGSASYVTTLIGKSSMGRLGLFLQVDACLGHQGVAHNWTLELCVRRPLRVYPRQIIGQVSFWQTCGSPQTYTGTYGVLNHPSPNLATLANDAVVAQ